MSTTSAPAVAQLLYLLDGAFDGSQCHSLEPHDWSWVPPGGQRSIRDIVGHVGGSKLMYHDCAYGDATLTWEDRRVAGRDAPVSATTAIGWLREGQQRLRQSVATLGDSELSRPRMTN